MRTENQRLLASPFLLSLALSLFLWCYAVLTTTIDRVPVSSFPILDMMPPVYWAGVVLLSGATIIWLFSSTMRWYHFPLLLAWTLYIYIGPELVEVTSRGFDATDHLFGVTAIELGRWEEWRYGWDGFYFLSSFIYKATGIGFYGLGKLMTIVLPLLRMVFVWYLASHLFQGKKEIIFFSILLIGSFWEGVSLDPSAQHLGLLMMLCMVAACFSPRQHDIRRQALIIMLFAGLILVHVLTPFVVALLITFFFVMSLTKRDFGYSQSVSGYTLGALFLVMFTAYLLFQVGGIFDDAAKLLVNAIREPFGAIQNTREPFTIRSTYMAFGINLIWLFYGITLVWMIIITASKEFWRKLTVKKIFPLLCLIPLLPILLAYGAASLPRFYILGVLFIVWFIIRGSRALPRTMVSCFLIVLLLLSFVERYSLEYRNYVPTEEWTVSTFIVDKIPTKDAVFRMPPWDPWVGSMANVYITPLERPMVSYNSKVWRRPEDIVVLGWADLPAPSFGILSSRTENSFRYFNGDEELSLVLMNCFGSERDVIYDSGDLQIYGYDYKPPVSLLPGGVIRGRPYSPPKDG